MKMIGAVIWPKFFVVGTIVSESRDLTYCKLDLSLSSNLSLGATEITDVSLLTKVIGQA
jgi:hypothetical protein